MERERVVREEVGEQAAEHGEVAHERARADHVSDGIEDAADDHAERAEVCIADREVVEVEHGVGALELGERRGHALDVAW